ncbi:MAG: 3-isopropylmalate dehydratase large subunit [Betaproteobacteria bacterium TMED156]|nr:MAG: 3-isopropylmalate dehydratase large subunit [Betaproteobacteria bacterium TMED156]
MKKTLYDKLWDEHFVLKNEDDTALLYIDRHLIHEVTSPQAFEGIEIANRRLWRNAANLAVVDHNVPTIGREKVIKDPVSRLQVETLNSNVAKHSIKYFDLFDKRQGIVHVIGPEQGATLPGMTVVCGDSHTSTHGAFACLAFGIGTSEVEHVLATQCLRVKKSKKMLIKINGVLGVGLSPKDVILYIIGKIGIAGGTGYSIEFAGDTVRKMSMEGRMTICNMAIEAGARSGMIAFDKETESFIKTKPLAPKGEMWEKALAYWNSLKSDDDASFDKIINIDASLIEPQITWGTSPEMVTSVGSLIPDPANQKNLQSRESYERAMRYMGVEPNIPLTSLELDKVFIGSCTNSRLEDLRAAAHVIKGRKKSERVKQVLVVPGSGLIKAQAEREGIDKIFSEAGFEWREPGCSMCLAMNADRLESGERCASTSNRNFEGRQGNGGRTHLVSPAMASAAAIAGKFVDVREF